MKFSKTICLLLLVLFSKALIAQENIDAKAVADEMDYNYFFKHVKYFASDELKGRDVGSEGYNKAAEYTAKEFKANGLKPFGDNGTYFQNIPFALASLKKESFDLSIIGKKGKLKGLYGENISILLNTKAKEFNETQELVFVGYGNVIPEKGIDDYKDIDVTGKTVIVAFGGPKDLKHSSLQNPMIKISNAVKKGASGVIAFFPGKGMLQGAIFKRFHAYIGGSRYLIADSALNKQLIDINLIVFAKQIFVKDLLTLSNINLSKELKAMKKGQFVSKKLDSEVNCSYKMDFKRKDCKNIVALLPGSDYKLQNEYVVVGAHLDHLGVGKAIKGDSIYNGMWDNATGAAATISIAKAFHDARIKPKRSIIFVNYTAEEKGLFGSHYLANSEILRDKKVVANVNIDMLGGLYEVSDIMPIGYSHSNLSKAVDFAAKKLNLTVSNATEYETMFIERSDQYSFIKTGVPPIYIGTGIKSIDPEIDVMKNTMKWMEKTYHSPFDDLNQKYSDKAFHVALKVNFLTTYYIANEMAKIKWKEDSWIFSKFIKDKKVDN